MTIPAVAWVWLPLAIAMLCALLKQTRPAIGLIVITLIGALLTGRMTPFATAFIVVGLGVAYMLPTQNKRWQCVGYSSLLVVSLALFFHRIPGFHNLQVLDNVIAGPGSVPFNMYLNLDKPIAVFLLMLAYPALLGQAKTVKAQPVVITLVLLFTLLPIAAFLGAIKPELSLPSWWWLFALNNLLLVCVTEEAIFRGFLQQTLTQRFGGLAGLLISSALFGLAHFPGGPLLVLFAGLAGAGYGLIFHLTGRLWAAVLTHFLFNAAHLLFFTYPMAAP